MLEREAVRDVEVMWLLKKLTPDFKTIADFRKERLAAIKGVCREFTPIRRRLGLPGGEPVAIDGGKFRADNSRERDSGRDGLARLIRRAGGKIAAHLDEAGRRDAAEAAATRPAAEGLMAKTEHLRERRRRCQGLAEEVRRSGASEPSLADPDSRLMSVRRGPDLRYDVQTAVDGRRKLIVRHEVASAHADLDGEALERMAEGLGGHPEKMRLRGHPVEHPFGTMKRGMNRGHFLLRGLKKVAAEPLVAVVSEQAPGTLKKRRKPSRDGRHPPH